MEDLSLHILDIVENSLRAHAKNISIRLVQDERLNRIVLEVTDDGDGMHPETLRRSSDPFFTTKEGKNTGLGLAFLGQSAREAGGGLNVESAPGRGTRVVASFIMNDIDRIPLGDIRETLRCLRATHPEVAVHFEHIGQSG